LFRTLYFSSTGQDHKINSSAQNDTIRVGIVGRDTTRDEAIAQYKSVFFDAHGYQPGDDTTEDTTLRLKKPMSKKQSDEKDAAMAREYYAERNHVGYIIVRKGWKYRPPEDGDNDYTPDSYFIGYLDENKHPFPKSFLIFHYYTFQPSNTKPKRK
jgi:hypothetical protein